MRRKEKRSSPFSKVSVASSGKGQSRTSVSTILVVSPAECLTSCFGPDWVRLVYDENLRIRRPDANIPYNKALAYKRSMNDRVADSQLTRIGEGTADILGRALGEALLQRQRKIQAVFAAPEMRCVQTACRVYESTGLERVTNGISVQHGYAGFYDGRPTPNFVSQFKVGDGSTGGHSLLTASSRESQPSEEPAEKWTKDGSETYKDFTERVERTNLYIRRKWHQVIPVNTTNPTVLVVVPPDVHIVMIASLRGQAVEQEKVKRYAAELPYLSMVRLSGTGPTRAGQEEWSFAPPYVPHLEYKGMKAILPDTFKDPFGGKKNVPSKESP